MEDFLEHYYVSSLSTIGFKPAPQLKRYNTCGHYFTLDPDAGQGYYWFYTIGNRFGIASYDFKLTNEQSLNFGPASFLYLGNVQLSGSQMIWEHGAVPNKSILGYVADNSHFKMTFKKNFHIRAIGFSLTEEFAAEILDRGNAGSYEHLKEVINRLRSGSLVPEISEAFRNIRGFRPSLEVADMYYESKVLEVVSLALQWRHNHHRQAGPRIDKSDLDHLEEIALYLKNHHAQPVMISDLAYRACMSRSKLSNLFKQIYGSTIIEYLHNQRLQRAKEMLTHSNLKISAIAEEVGYKLHSSFSEIFKQHTGYTPHEYRLLGINGSKTENINRMM